jgi:uncharacterized protein (TIGR02118 family)
LHQRANIGITTQQGTPTMAQLIALYKMPADPTAFDAHYYGTHVPLAKTIPGLRGYTVSTGTIATPAGEAPLHLVAVLDFDSLADTKSRSID